MKILKNIRLVIITVLCMTFLDSVLFTRTVPDPSNKIKPLIKAIEKQPVNGEYHFQLGLLFNEIAEYDKAIAALNEAERLGVKSYWKPSSLRKSVLHKVRCQRI